MNLKDCQEAYDRLERNTHNHASDGANSMEGFVSRVFKWPRGRYNGRRITGFRLDFSFRVDTWQWLPVAERNYGEPFVLWLCFRVAAKLQFHYLDYPRDHTRAT